MRKQAYVYLIGGTLLAVVSGGLLAWQVASGALGGGALLVGALIAFVPVVALEGYGLYLLGQSVPAGVNNEMGASRLLSDLLRERGSVTLRQAAEACGTGERAVYGMLGELARMRLLASYVDHRTDRVHLLSMAQADALDRCMVCATAMPNLDPVDAMCPECGSVYYLPDRDR